MRWLPMRLLPMRLLFLLLLLTSEKLCAQTLKICLSTPYAYPFITSEADYKKGNKGILTNAIEAAANEQKIDLRFIRVSWLRCLRDVKTNRVNAVLGIIKTPTRELQYAYPPNEDWYLVNAKYPLFITQGGHLDQPETLRQLAEHPSGFNIDFYRSKKQFGLSAPVGYVVYHKLLKHKLNGQDYTPDEGLRQLANGRLDGYIVESLIGENLIAYQGLTSRVKQTSVIALEEKWHIAFNQQYYQGYKKQTDRFWQDAAKYSQLFIRQYREGD